MSDAKTGVATDEFLLTSLQGGIPVALVVIIGADEEQLPQCWKSSLRGVNAW